MEKLKVESYSGFKAEERPLRFFINNRKIEIISIQNDWLAPEGRYFKVVGDDGRSYVLEYKETDDTWNLLTPKNLP
jgi:hypothetical protein